MKTDMKIIGVVGVVALFTIIGMSFAGLSGPSPIPNPPTFGISSTAITLCKGETNYIPINVTNGPPNYPSIGVSNFNGSGMQDVEIAVSPTRGLLPVGNGTVYIGNINPRSSNTIYLPIFVTSNASLITSVTVGINYYYLELYSDSEARNLTFEVSTCPSSLSVSVNPKTVTSGEIQNISVNFTNTGMATLKALYVHYTVPSQDGAFIGSSQKTIGSLAPGGRYRLNATMFVSRNASIQSFPFNLTATFYNGSDELEQISNSTSLIPVGAIDLSSSGLTISPTTATPGGIFSISFVLTDIGTSGASAVSVGAITPKGFSSFGSNPVYVGDISADSQAPVTLTLESTNSIKPGTYQIPVRISYLNSLRQNVTTTSNVSIVVGSGISSSSGISGSGVRYSSGGGSLLTGLLLPIILIIIIIAISYLYIKERAKNKKDGRREQKGESK